MKNDTWIDLIDDHILVLYDHVINTWHGTNVRSHYWWALMSIVVYFVIGCAICVLKIMSTGEGHNIYLRFAMNFCLVLCVSTILWYIYRYVHRAYAVLLSRDFLGEHIWKVRRILITGICVLCMVYYVFVIMRLHHFGGILFICEYFAVMSFFYFLACTPASCKKANAHIQRNI